VDTLSLHDALPIYQQWRPCHRLGITPTEELIQQNELSSTAMCALLNGRFWRRRDPPDRRSQRKEWRALPT
jgi:hypothetical protein